MSKPKKSARKRRAETVVFDDDGSDSSADERDLAAFHNQMNDVGTEQASVEKRY